MNCNSVGIVLKKPLHSRSKIIVLDKKYGRVEGVASTVERSCGMLLAYTLCMQQKTFFLRDVRLVHTPVALGRTDVLFLHHILEVIYYFAPIGSCVQGIFDLLAFLYTIEHMLISVKFKKFFLFKLLTLLGVTPELEAMPAYFCHLQIITIDGFNDTIIDEIGEKKLDVWLWGCLVQHPSINEFKTVHFLEKNRTL